MSGLHSICELGHPYPRVVFYFRRRAKFLSSSDGSHSLIELRPRRQLSQSRFHKVTV